MFYQTRNYSILSLRFLWTLKSMNKEARDVFDKHGTFSNSGDPGTGIAADGYMELV